ncbi:MAG: hypothetical protein JWM04_1530 [Verrucomicrobiales bacterium]|nr:hypothetical protein [Verrucomicrobiales bacterium]
MIVKSNTNPEWTYTVEIILPPSKIVTGNFVLLSEDPNNPKVARLTLCFEGRETSKVGTSFDYALNSIREELEKGGILLKCWGSSRNVWPSSVTSGMGRVGRAYRRYMGKKPAQDDIVVIFESGTDVDPCTLQEQREAHNQWRSSVGISKK